MATATDHAPMQWTSLTFALPPHVSKFGPRTGRIALSRHIGDDNTVNGATGSVAIDTPAILVGTSRGVVPHLSRDHTNGSDAIRWINVPFESFLEQDPPVPTLQNGPRPLHTFLGFDADRHIASLCLRNPLDTREMPPNGNMYVSANCVRGVRKVTPSDWRTYVCKMQPDVVVALTDTPYTPPPYSQKRITKSIERSTAWVADLLRPLPDLTTGAFESDTQRASRHPLNVLVHMAGGTSIPAREAFAYGLQETLHGPEAEVVKPLRSLDEGISGYVFDLATLRGITPGPNISQHQNLPDSFLRLERSHMLQYPESIIDTSTPNATGEISLMESSVSPLAEQSTTHNVNVASLFKASLKELSERKLRVVTGIRSPHEMLRLVRDVGVDLFDVGWAMVAANMGIALDFVFPVRTMDDREGRRHLGHNLYDPVHARQFVHLADTFAGAGESGGQDATETNLPVCPCIACSPRLQPSCILHSTVDQRPYAPASEEAGTWYGKPHSRAYVHHLLHTHEMSAHTLLVAHNLAVVSAFLDGVRHVWVESEDEGRNVGFTLEVDKFLNAYDESGELFVCAKKDWECVDRARGKGRLAREREKQEDGQAQ